MEYQHLTYVLSPFLIRLQELILSANRKRSGKQQQFQKKHKNMENPVKIEYTLEGQHDFNEDGRKIGTWTALENLLYTIFIDQHKILMASKKKRKTFKIFDQMANFIATRNPLQCRSHHQKIIQKYLEIKTAIAVFKKHYGGDYYRSQYLLHTKHTRKTEAAPAKCNSSRQQEECSSQLLASPSSNVNNPICNVKAENSKQVEAAKLQLGQRKPQCRSEQTLQPRLQYNQYLNNGFLHFPFLHNYYPLFVYPLT